MLIRFGLGGQLSGSAGGLTAAHNRYGQYVRNRSVPVNPNSNRQQAVRAAFAAATIAWKTITQGERDAWTAYAQETPILNRLGESVTPTGNVMFVRTNTFRFGLGATLLTAAPTSPGLSSLGSGLSIGVAEDGEITFTAVGGTALGPAIAQIGPPLSIGRNFFAGPYTLSGTTALIATGGTFPAPTATRYGLAAAGERRPIRVQGSDAAGRLSDVFEQIVTVT